GPNGRLVLISAPELKSGFNRITIHYSFPIRSKRFPIGCEVVRFEVESHGGVDRRSAARVAICDDDFRRAAGDDDLARRVLHACSTDFGRYKTIVAKVREQAGTVTDALLIERMIGLEWAG